MIKKVTIFGGTGFLGRYIVHRFVRDGYEVCVITRSLDNALPLKSYGKMGQVKLIQGNPMVELKDEWFPQDGILINCIGILYEGRKKKFRQFHCHLPKSIAEKCKKNKVKNFVHVSALGSDINSPSKYAQSKAEGEIEILKSFPRASIIRPSLIFGPEDNFFNMFAGLRAISPFIPLIRKGKILFQPCFVNDVAEAIFKVAEGDKEGVIYELGGPSTYSFKELLAITFSINHKKTIFIPIPSFMMWLTGFFMEMLPQPLVTRDQLKLLKKDNICSLSYPGFKELEISPRSLENVLPTYIIH